MINKQSVLLAATIEYEKWIKENFKASGKKHKRSALHWKKLADSTIERRRKGGGQGNPKILRDTGNLMLRWDITANNQEGKIRSGVNYSSIHENGGKDGNIPMRKIFPSDKQGREIVQPVFEKFVKKAWK